MYAEPIRGTRGILDRLAGVRMRSSMLIRPKGIRSVTCDGGGSRRVAGRKIQRVLVVGAPFGDGHMRAADAVGCLLRQRNPDLEVAVEDMFAHLFRPLHLNRAFRSAYRWSTSRFHGHPHRRLYQVASGWPGIVCRLSDLALGRSAARWLRRIAPDLVIATHPVAAYLCAQRQAARDTPVIPLVTDSGPVNRIWFHGRYDRLLLTDPGTREHAVRVLGPTSNVTVIGAPVLPALYTRRQQAESRDRLGLCQRFTVLLTAGGAGLGHGVLAAARHLAGSDLDVQLILNAGDNKELLARFHDIAAHRPWLVRGPSDDFEVLLAACDLVIGKAGWFTLNEAAFSGRPTLIVDVVPGQEEFNAHAAEAMGVARCVRPSEIVSWVRRYASAPNLLRTDFAVDEPARFVAGWPLRLARALSDLVLMAEPTTRPSSSAP
ncbi:MGDG synthase family glycosyltransferase [Micromonospora sp. SL1-18]|uniref:MGDG synthase family glycosyltransferase n=1 Tax=Micromonospora sp. SL1-18 TaxID=3399128 RepID=UPI003A4E5DDF